jgi:hypothetical protein
VIGVDRFTETPNVGDIPRRSGSFRHFLLNRDDGRIRREPFHEQAAKEAVSAGLF